MTSNQWASCPFCGDRDIRCKFRGNPLAGGWFIECGSCSCEIGPFESQTVAWKTWNTRGGVEPQPDSSKSFFHECAHFVGYTPEPDYRCPKCLPDETECDREDPKARIGSPEHTQAEAIRTLKASGEQLYRLRPLCTCRPLPEPPSDNCPIHGIDAADEHGSPIVDDL